MSQVVNGSEHRHDLVILGGRVIDPESGTDAQLNVGVTGSTITAVTTLPIMGARTLDARGRVVAPGWIDLHSHAQSVAGGRLQARDGVTSALELESGVLDVAHTIRLASLEGRPINFGFSSSWELARLVEVAGLDADDPLADLHRHKGSLDWMRAGTKRELIRLKTRIAANLESGAIGIGFLLGYAPEVEPSEYLEMSCLAASYNAGTFTHARDLVEHHPRTLIDGAIEIVQAAEATGVRAHYCHINSTSLKALPRVHDLIRRASSTVTTEAYPYGAGSTSIEAAFLSPDRLYERALEPSSLVYTPTGERIQNRARLEELRRTDPGGLVIVHLLDESKSADQDIIDEAMLFEGTVVASDAMPLKWPGLTKDPFNWPPPSATTTHPRGAGTFSRFLRRYVVELEALTLLEAVARCSFRPATILEPYVPAMARKGRLKVGADADIVVIDLSRISDRATYSNGALPSVGYELVLVNGTPIVRDDELDLQSFPGRAITAA